MFLWTFPFIHYIIGFSKKGNYMESIYNLSACIPAELVDEIRKNGKEWDDRHVYRVAKRGEIDEIGFLNSYEEALYDNRSCEDDLTEIGTYSTSCYLTPKRPRKFMKFLKKKFFESYPQPIIIHGNTICGLSQITKERILDYPDDEHIDWWIYQGSYDKLIVEFEVFEEFGSERSVK